MSIEIIDPNIFTLLGSEPWLVPKNRKNLESSIKAIPYGTSYKFARNRIANF